MGVQTLSYRADTGSKVWNLSDILSCSCNGYFPHAVDKEGELLTKIFVMKCLTEFLKFKKMFLSIACSLFLCTNPISGCELNLTWSGTTYGNLPLTINFSAEADPSGTYEWRVDGNIISGQISSIYTHIFNADQTYTICVKHIECDISVCKEVPINYYCEECGLIPNGGFEEIFNASPPGDIGCSDYFDIDVCGWIGTASTPFYCAFPENNYIGLNGNFVDSEERATTEYTIEGPEFQIGNRAHLSFRYSVQRNHNTGAGALILYGNGFRSIELKLDNTIIGNVSGPLPYNYPSSTHNTNDYLSWTEDCGDPFALEWETFNTDFIITAAHLNKKLSIQPFRTNNTQGNRAVAFIDNVCLSVDPPGSCTTPAFNISGSGCIYTVNITNHGTPGEVYLVDFGDGTVVTSSDPNISHTYKYPGDFNICVTRQCTLGTSTVICKPLKITKVDCPCLNYTAINQVITARKCELNGNNSYLANICVEVPKGYGPCQQEGSFLDVDGLNGVYVNSYNVSSVNATTDLLCISFNLTAFRGSGCPGGGSVNLTFSTCNEAGEVLCFEAVVKCEACAECEEHPILIQASCDQNNSETGHYVYTGTHIFNNADVLSFTSTSGNFSYNPTTGEFTIKTNQPGPFTSCVLFKVFDNVNLMEKCVLVCIEVKPENACPEDICETITPLSLNCTESGALYSVYMINNLQTPAGYKICDMYIEGYNNFQFQEIPSGGIPGSYGIRIEMPNSNPMMQTYRMVIKYCDERFGFITDCYDIMFMCMGGGGGDRVIGNQSFQQDKWTETEEIFVYPNPSKEQIHVVINPPADIKDEYEVIIQDMTGRVLRRLNTTSRNNTIKVDDLSQGMYMIHIRSNEVLKHAQLISIIP
jgi:hypothetical protein